MIDKRVPSNINGVRAEVAPSGVFSWGRAKGQTIFISFFSRMNIWVKVTRTRYKDNRGLALGLWRVIGNEPPSD
jgi:hypothetical protein